jgi:hypothetical protein
VGAYDFLRDGSCTNPDRGRNSRFDVQKTPIVFEALARVLALPEEPFGARRWAGLLPSDYQSGVPEGASLQDIRSPGGCESSTGEFLFPAERLTPGSRARSRSETDRQTWGLYDRVGTDREENRRALPTSAGRPNDAIGQVGFFAQGADRSWGVGRSQEIERLPRRPHKRPERRGEVVR